MTSVTSTIQEARAAELEQGIMAFMQDTEAHPFFMEVANDIAPLIESGAAKSLAEAYELAVLKNPITRLKQIERDAAKKAASDAAAQATKLAAAKKATGVNVKSRTAGKGAPPAESIDDTLRSTMAAIHSRTH
jgi:hypothetical protein